MIIGHQIRSDVRVSRYVRFKLRFGTLLSRLQLPWAGHGCPMPRISRHSHLLDKNTKGCVDAGKKDLPGK
jgi:hypothetical protein